MTENSNQTASAELIDNEYWLGGIWDAEGRLLWSSEPESFDTEAEAIEAAQRHINNE